jgi:DNA-binding XRE family transcriptional regulator
MDPTSLAAIGARLRSFRDILGITQHTFAKWAGLTQQALAQYESGKRKPTVDIAAAFCDTYGLTLDYIYRGDVRGLSQERLRSLVIG